MKAKNDKIVILILTKYILFYKHKVHRHIETQMLGKISMLLSIHPARENLVILRFFPEIK